MANPIQAISRLFQKKPKNALVHELYTKAIGRPLLAHAQMGAMVLKGYLNAPITDDEAQDPVQVEEGIGVIDISGALVSRPVGFCSPLSYAEIQSNFDALLADESVSHIVLRIDSAGGEASNMFDLSDHIFNARGIKPIIAVVDDMAYSAAYGIASAADQVIVSRTGGVGSVGVVAYHIDESVKNKRKGIKVEYLYAGEKKVYGNSSEPLADEARLEMQAEINRLYDLFVETVARNRELDAQAVRDTQAGTYHGAAAVDVGFADAVLSFNQVITNLLQTGQAIQTQAGGHAQTVHKPVLEKGEEQTDKNLPQDFSNTRLDNEAQEQEIAEQPSETPSNTPALTSAQVAEIKAMCKAAGLSEVAEDYITAGTLPEVVRADLFSAISAGEKEIVTAQASLSSHDKDGLEGLSAHWVYQQRNQA